MSALPASSSRSVPGKAGLLRTAIDCFARHGYAGTSIDRIVRAAGVTKGALYYHFRDKEHLRFEAVTERIQAFESFVLEQTEDLEDPAIALRRVAAICCENARTDNHRRFILTMMVEAIDTNDSLSNEFEEMLRRFRSFCRHRIRRGQEDGLFRQDIDARVAAESLVGGILGAEVQYYQDPEVFDLDRSLTAHIDQLLAWLAPREDAKHSAGNGGT